MYNVCIYHRHIKQPEYDLPPLLHPLPQEGVVGRHLMQSILSHMLSLYSCTTWDFSFICPLLVLTWTMLQDSVVDSVVIGHLSCHWRAIIFPDRYARTVPRLDFLPPLIACGIPRRLTCTVPVKASPLFSNSDANSGDE